MKQRQDHKVRKLRAKFETCKLRDWLIDFVRSLLIKFSY